MVNREYYKVGGSLEYQHPTYVVRQADAQLYQGLINGELNSVTFSTPDRWVNLAYGCR
ncbi:MAG: hypothetical protein RIE73_28330 [Coleofasciculus sp. C1-SOL-03]|uniref:hypothetical protein n=1 Tax=Coleofasciculus sp. C1-SOL-03 TaxID=3069522 RepID=UPI00330479A6